MSEKSWKEFVKWSHSMATGAQNGFATEWPGVSVMTTEKLLTKYRPAKNERLRAALLERAKKETCGLHCVNNTKL